jgi:hypothetical protein
MSHETAQRESPGMYQSQRSLADILRRHRHGRPQTDHWADTLSVSRFAL